MILFTGADAFAPVKLLEQYDAHEPVRKGHIGKGNPVVCAADDFLGQSVGTANDEHDPSTVG